jgi:hypothetical protein
MAGRLVILGVQGLMRRYVDYQGAGWFQMVLDGLQETRLIVNVLQDIEEYNKIEFVVELL